MSAGQSMPVVWRYESCLDCQKRMPSHEAAEAHNRLTGHLLGWPVDEDEMSWPIMEWPK
jgi:hypothetical protein